MAKNLTIQSQWDIFKKTIPEGASVKKETKQRDF